jgi:hypothetical protein
MFICGTSAQQCELKHDFVPEQLKNSHQSDCCVHNVFVRFYFICNKGKCKVATVAAP